MIRRLNSLTPHLPAALLLLFSSGAGTFLAGAEAAWATLGHLALLGFVGAFGVVSLDPLRLGRGRWWLVALGIAALASHLLSPVSRAGRLGLLLLPAFMLVPSAVARCWPDDRARRLGLRSISVGVVGIAGYSLWGWWRLETPGAALPLGHNNLLAAWLLVVLPLSVLPWRETGVGRLLACLSGVVGLIAIVGTGSLAAALAVVGVILVWVACDRRVRWGMVGIAAIGATQLPRIFEIARGADASVMARWSYLQAAWRGLGERPILGWGPGSARWTLSEYLRPIPGVYDPGDVVADPHSWPPLLAYELGWIGGLLTLGLLGAFCWRRPKQIVDPGLRRAAWLGLAALLIMSCAGRPLAASATPLAAALGVGAIFASERATPGGRRPLASVLTAVLAGGLAVFIVPLDLAHLAYDRATLTEQRGEQLRQLRRAVALDPKFPLYQARLAWLAAADSPEASESVQQAQAAAEQAQGVAPLWLVAGILGQEAGESWSRDALMRACRLSPMGVMAPFRLTLEPEASAAALTGRSVDAYRQWTARALLAEPVVVAAASWRDRGTLLRDAVAEIGRLEGVDRDWHAWLEEVLAAREAASEGPVRQLALAMDTDSALSVSLYAFRRRPWPLDLARLEIDSGLLAAIELGAGAPLDVAPLEVFEDSRCGLNQWAETP